MDRLLVLCLFLSGCASTTIYDHGQPVFHTQADATNVTIDIGPTHFHADTLNHSMPTLAGGQCSAQVIGASAAAVGTVAGSVVIGGVVK